MPAAAAAAELDAGTPPALAMLARTTAATPRRWRRGRRSDSHGVLNTDNMSVLGLTLDYGPFAFVERFDPNFTPNLSDRDGRYAFIRQPEVAGWNLRRFGGATRAGLVSARQARKRWTSTTHTFARRITRIGAKFGVRCEDDDAANFLRGFLRLLASSRADFTLAHRARDASDPSPPRPVPPRATTRCWHPGGVPRGVSGRSTGGSDAPPIVGEWLRAYGATLRAGSRRTTPRVAGRREPAVRPAESSAATRHRGGGAKRRLERRRVADGGASATVRRTAGLERGRSRPISLADARGSPRSADRRRAVAPWNAEEEEDETARPRWTTGERRDDDDDDDDDARGVRSWRSLRSPEGGKRRADRSEGGRVARPRR